MRQIKIKGMMKAVLWFVISVFFSFKQLSAQNGATRIIKGKVTASVSQSSVPGATISVKGTRNSVSAGDAGDFTIYAQTGDVLVVSYVGYKTKEVKIGEGVNTLNIGLTQDYSNLQDVVVIGYGKTKKSDLSSAVGTISNTELTKTINVTLDEALQGKASMFNILKQAASLKLQCLCNYQGVSTLTGNYQPLYPVQRQYK